MNSMFNDAEFMHRRVIMQTSKRMTGQLKYKVEVAVSRTKCYITCMRGSRACQVIWLWGRQALKLLHESG